jgi:hypothetical protein
MIRQVSTLAAHSAPVPEDPPLEATAHASRKAEHIIREVAEEYGREHKKPGGVLKSLTTFVGGGGPQFWLSATPEARQPIYAQIVIEVEDKHDHRPPGGPMADSAHGGCSRGARRHAPTGTESLSAYRSKFG